jgi:DNA polymerase-3 subunit gamma/tau
VAASDSVDDDLPELDEIVEALAERDVSRGLVAVAHLTAAGFSPQQLTGDLVEYLRQGFLALMARDLVTFSGTERDELATRAERVGLAALVRGMEVLGEAQVAMRDAPDPRVNLEVALIRLTHPEADDSPGALLARIERLEAAGRAQTSAPDGTRPAHGVAAGATAAASAAAAPAPASPEAASAPAPASPEAASAPAPVSAAAPASPEATALAARPGKGKKTIGAAIRGSAPSAGGADPGRAAQTSTEPPEPPEPPVPPTGTTTAPAGSGGPPEPAAAAPVNPESFPTRDQLVQAWGDHIIGRLRPKAKALFQAGRFVGVDGDRAVFGLPNDMHRTRCEDVRGDVEAALSEHFGQPVGLTLVVDPGGAEGPASTDAASPDPAPAAPPAARPSSPGAPEGTGEPPADPPPPPSASDPTGPESPRRPGQNRHSDRHSGDELQHQQAAEAGESDEEDDLSAFDESELGEIADIDNSAEARVLQAFPGAEEVL